MLIYKYLNKYRYYRDCFFKDFEVSLLVINELYFLFYIVYVVNDLNKVIIILKNIK